MKEIVFHDGITSIGENAFEYCTKIKSLNLPKSLTKISNLAFEACYNLETINYNGTKAEFLAIEKGYGWLFDNSESLVIKCTDGELSKSELEQA